MIKQLNDEIYNFWNEKLIQAKSYMKSKTGKKVLIECAAQHPLKDGFLPGEEFEKRLNKTIELYNEYKSQGFEVKIYVPGSRHKSNNIADKISLSLCGKKYLISKNIPSNDIYSVLYNQKYKGFEGVYNSADECYVASKIFKDENFDKLISVASPAQMFRKTLFYIYFGVMPQNYTAPTDDMFHDYVDELFNKIMYVLLEDNSLQENNSREAIVNRNDRCPYLKNKINTLADMSIENFDESYQIDQNELLLEKQL